MTLVRTLLASLILLAGACSACSSSVGVTPAAPSQDAIISRSLEATAILFPSSAKSLDDLVCAAEHVDARHLLTAYHCAIAMAVPRDEIDLMEAIGGSIMDFPPSRALGKHGVYTTYHDVQGDGPQAAIYDLVIVRLDKEHDLALLETAPSHQPVVPVASYKPAVGAPVYSIGHPFGLIFTYAHGAVSMPCRVDPRVNDGNECWLQADIAIHGGSSGGGLYDSVGQLIGVASSGNGQGDEGFFTPGADIARFLGL